MKENITPIVALVLGALLIGLLSRPMGKAPALGPFLSPSLGYLQNRESDRELMNQKLPANLTKDSVVVVMDSLLIPHIYAQSLEDAYRVQGYLMAKYRYWQMDFISRVAAGRLSEVVGKQAIEFDKKQRRKGLAKAAEKTNEAWKSYPISYAYLEAFSKGVNTYLKGLTSAGKPIEFKLLGYETEPWSPLNSALFFKHMSDVLCSKEKDFEMTNARDILGEATFNLLYPERLPESPPVIPSEKTYGLGLPFMGRDIQLDNPGIGVGSLNRPYEEKASGLGSNNWAVAPVKSEDGWPLLANDPHLPLTLPSIWYLAHINTPQMNVMGVCFPGIPGVILGFNDHISWGVTNVGQDVLDWLLVEWDKKSSTYQWGDETKRIEWREEVIQVKGGKPVIDSVPWTEYGPIWTIDTRDGPKDAIMRWLALETPETDEMNVFPGVNKAKNWMEFKSAISKFNTPPQNFIFASKKGDIGLQVQGNFPYRSRPFGRFIEKAQPSDTWKTHLPGDDVPSITNPNQGYLASANQVSTDDSYPYYYLNADFRPARARTINQKLDTTLCVSIPDMKDLQLNNYDIESHNFIEAALPLLNKQDDLTQALETWSGNFTASCSLCPLVILWKSSLDETLYDELLAADSLDIDFPNTWTTIELLRLYPKHEIIDHPSTTFKDSANNIVTMAYDLARQRYDSLSSKDWKSFRNTRITHIIPSLTAFGHFDIPAGGAASAPNALRGNKGPSWRFIDQLDDGNDALGVYPGGQSGHAGSQFYDNLLPAWIEGQYYDLKSSQSPEEVANPMFIFITPKS